MKELAPSRLVDQRVRNRLMEALEILAEGDDGVRCVGASEYFNGFYDWIPHRDDGEMYPNSAITPEERALLQEVSSAIDDACDATPQFVDTEVLIATGWPDRVGRVALKALSCMRDRGRFSEDKEEESPSIVA